MHDEEDNVEGHDTNDDHGFDDCEDSERNIENHNNDDTGEGTDCGDEAAKLMYSGVPVVFCAVAVPRALFCLFQHRHQTGTTKTTRASTVTNERSKTTLT